MHFNYSTINTWQWKRTSLHSMERLSHYCCTDQFGKLNTPMLGRNFKVFCRTLIIFRQIYKLMKKKITWMYSANFEYMYVCDIVKFTQPISLRQWYRYIKTRIINLYMSMRLAKKTLGTKFGFDVCLNYSNGRRWLKYKEKCKSPNAMQVSSAKQNNYM